MDKREQRRKELEEKKRKLEEYRKKKDAEKVLSYPSSYCPRHAYTHTIHQAAASTTAASTRAKEEEEEEARKREADKQRAALAALQQVDSVDSLLHALDQDRLLPPVRWPSCC